ncbi:MAG: P-protein [Planctomycetota bacterium]
MSRTPAKTRRKSAPSAPGLERDLDALRAKIDALDGQIVALINERAGIASSIGKRKAQDGVKPYAPSREKQVYQRVAKLNRGPLPDTAFQSIYREIMSATIALEHPIRVAYFGQPGSFTHLAARTKFGASVRYTAQRDMRDVFMAVSRGRADYGVIPIENSTEGGVNQSIDMLGETRLKICSEVFLPIHHHLLSQSASKDIRILYSHPQAFAQCRNWLAGHLGDVERKEVGSTAEAAERASREKHAGAIAGSLAAEIYKVPVQVENIEDQAENITRFCIVGERMAEPTGHDKTSVVVSILDEPGALMRLLLPFQNHGINLTRIESRPSRRRAWDYVFYIDMQGHATDPKLQGALREVESQSRHVEVLGSYPAVARVPSPKEHASLSDHMQAK